MKDYSKLATKVVGRLKPNPSSDRKLARSVQQALAKLPTYYDGIWQINDAIEKALLSVGLRLKGYVDQAVPYGQTRNMILPTTDPSIFIAAQIYRMPNGSYELTAYSTRDARRSRRNPVRDLELVASPFSRYSELTSFTVLYRGRKIGSVHQNLNTGLWEAIDNAGRRHGDRYLRPNLAAEQLYYALGLGLGRAVANPSSEPVTEFDGEELTTKSEAPPEIVDDIESAEEVYKEFHGKPSDEILEVEEDHIERDALTVLGQLVQLVVQSAANESIYKVNFDADVMLCCSPDRKQLYVVGGEQSLDLESMGFSESAIQKDKVFVGSVLQVTYRTRKHFDDFDVIDYVHDMGEEGGTLPVLAYDRLNQNLEFIGGDYEIKPEGIVN